MNMSVEVVEQVIPVKTGKKPEKTPEEPRKTEKIYRGPSKRGPCRVCGKTGIRRYMIACDLPEPMILCDEHYKMIREELRAALRRILQEKGLLPRKIIEAEIGKYSVKVEKREEPDYIG